VVSNKNIKVKSFKDLQIWKKGIELVIDIYKTTLNFPKVELYGLTSQLRKAAVSIPSNIAEGCSRFHRAEYKQFLYVSIGSCAEVQTQLVIASRLGYLKDHDAENLLNRTEEISKMTMGLIKKLSDY